MTQTLTVFPDVEVVLVGYVKTLSLPVGTVVSTSVPVSYDGSQSICRIDRTAGSTEWPLYDHPVVQISCWGPDRASAAALLDVVRLGLAWPVIGKASLHTWGASISNPIERLGPQWFDEDGYIPAGRYMFELEMTLRNG